MDVILKPSLALQNAEFYKNNLNTRPIPLVMFILLLAEAFAESR
jgi:hypothetical protein